PHRAGSGRGGERGARGGDVAARPRHRGRDSSPVRATAAEVAFAAAAEGAGAGSIDGARAQTARRALMAPSMEDEEVTAVRVTSELPAADLCQGRRLGQ